MTGVEKVREWAEETVEDVNGDHWPRCACLAYGSYLRGLIETAEQLEHYDWYLTELAIAAWKKEINGA